MRIKTLQCASVCFRSLLVLLALFLSGPSYAQTLSTVSYPTDGDFVSAESNTIYFGPGSRRFDEWRITFGYQNRSTELHDSGTRNFTNSVLEYQLGGLPADGRDITMTFWQRVRGGSWDTFTVVYRTENTGQAPVQPTTPQTQPAPQPTPQPQPAPQPTPQQPTPQPEPRPSAVDPAFISYPSAGAQLSASGNTVYFGPGATPFDEWRITVGLTPASTGLFDSGVKSLAGDPWEINIGGVTSNQSVTLRFWQRVRGGEWTISDTLYNGSAPTASVPSPSAPAPVTVTEPATSPAPQPTTNNGDTVQALRAQHRNGQTFLTWTEVSGNAGYHVYRHTSSINANNLSAATRLTERWGPLDANTSVNPHAHGSVPSTYVISDLASPLSRQTGLFVHTTARSGNAFYAVTSVINGVEVLRFTNNNTVGAVRESVTTTKPVLTASFNGGRGRVYTQYMDYANWNPTQSGYAYNYAVALPANYNPSRSYPLQLQLHAYGERFKILSQAEFDWEVIQLIPNDPGENEGTTHSWWYGYSADHNYNSNSAVPTRGQIANFTEQRVIQAIDEVIRDSAFNVDPQLVHVYGHSMGASGAIGLGIRYGNVISGIYGSEGMTNYRASPMFQEDFTRLWGRPSSNLPIVNRGLHSSSIARQNGTGVWDWMNHQQQMFNRRAEPMAFLMTAHGKEDFIIDWPTQGRPLINAFNDAKVGFSANVVGGAGHSWLSFSATVFSQFGFGNGELFDWRYPLNQSFPSIQRASGSGPLTPGNSGTDQYNLNVEWATPATRFAPTIVDQANRYEISIRSLAGNQTANITPQRTQRFSARNNQTCSWTTTDNNNGNRISSGTTRADNAGLVTVNNVAIRTGTGTLLAINCP